MISTIYKRAFSVLRKKPLRLWGISLLGSLLSTVLTFLCGFAIPGLGLAVTLLLSTSMTMVFLHGYRGEEVKAIHLFDCFKDWNTIKRVTCGLAWTNLWIFLWGLIPIVGPIFAIVRSYEYRLTPYILITEPDVPLTEAMKVSKQRTNGHKLQMWGAEVLFYVGCIVAACVLFLLSRIPVIGILFALVFAVLLIAVLLFGNLFLGLVQAAFYEEITHPTFFQNNTAPLGQANFCSGCGNPLPNDGSLFCSACGKPRN